MSLARLTATMPSPRITVLLAVLAGACTEPQLTSRENLPHPVAETRPVPAEKPTAEPSATATAKPSRTQKHEPPTTPAPPATARASTAPEPTTTARPAPLDLPALVQRLHDTKAVGLFTKVALKNQVDDLLGEFRAYYSGKSAQTLADLRRPYDLLVMKILALLQQSDPALANDIVASRERIWSFLSDRSTFSTI